MQTRRNFVFGHFSHSGSNNIVIDKAGNWNELLFKEALLIKSPKPSLNTGLKALKELQLF